MARHVRPDETEIDMGAEKRARPKPSARDGRKAVARARAGGRRTRWLCVAATVLVAAALLAVVVIAVTKNGGTKTSDTATASLNNPPATVAVGANSMPPWPAPADATAAVKAADYRCWAPRVKWSTFTRISM